MFIRRGLIGIERRISRRRISTNEIEKYENEWIEEVEPLQTKSTNLNYKLWKQKMAQKEQWYSIPFNKYKSYEQQLGSMKNKKILEEKFHEEQIKPTQHLTPIKKNNQTEWELSKTAMSIVGIHIICFISWYYMDRSSLLQNQ